MELLELLKIINDQGGQADTQAQIEALKEAMIKLHSDQAWFTSELFFFAVGLFMFFEIIEEIRWYRISKRLKKLELANALKDS
jgi:hypothetical protein